jgi:hypothetical protein
MSRQIRDSFTLQLTWLKSRYGLSRRACEPGAQRSRPIEIRRSASTRSPGNRLVESLLLRRSSICVVTHLAQLGFGPCCFLISSGITAWQRGSFSFAYGADEPVADGKPGASAECRRDKRHESHKRSQINAARLSVVYVHFGDQSIPALKENPPALLRRRGNRY